MRPQSVITTLQELIRINSVNPAYASGQPEGRIQAWIQDFFASAGIPAELVEVFPERPNLLATLQGRDRSRRLLLEAHVDTAGVENMVSPPFEPSMLQGRIYGRGACDTKGGLAAMMHALVELHVEGFVPSCDVVLAATMDEEATYRGAAHLCEHFTADAAIVAEPTELRLVVASKGCLRWRVAIGGRAAHSSTPHLGINAISRMARLIVVMEEGDTSLRTLRHPLVGEPTLNVGLIRGGAQVNIVPEQCQVEIDRRLVPGEAPPEIQRQYEQLSETLRERFPDMQITHTTLLEDWPMETSPDSHIVRTAQEALGRLNLPSEPAGVPFGSDASKFTRAGIPSIVMGPGSIDQAHTAAEYVAMEQVLQAVNVYKEIIRGF
ncbi:MAG: M20 family metallopeptidase [Acidobacteria bacterium]|nr:M20 family metallopeptidase [Acidobacteriota bacterium]